MLGTQPRVFLSHQAHPPDLLRYGLGSQVAVGGGGVGTNLAATSPVNCACCEPDARWWLEPL